MSAEIASSGSNSGVEAELCLIGKSADYAVGTLDNHVVLFWRRKAVHEGALRARKAFLEITRERPESKIGFLTVVDARCEISASGDVRDEVAETLRVYQRQLGAAAVAFEGVGFRISVARSVITAINLASRTRFPNSVFSETHGAAAWVHRQMAAVDGAVSIERLLSAVEQLRALASAEE
jgi:hypothetical protein